MFSRKFFAVVFLIFFLFAGFTFGQQIEMTIDQLKSAHNRLKKIADDSNTGAEVKAINQTFLNDNEVQLKAALNKVIAEFVDYRAVEAKDLTAEQLKQIDDKIEGYKYDLSQLSQVSIKGTAAPDKNQTVSTARPAASPANNKPSGVDSANLDSKGTVLFNSPPASVSDPDVVLQVLVQNLPSTASKIKITNKYSDAPTPEIKLDLMGPAEHKVVSPTQLVPVTLVPGVNEIALSIVDNKDKDVDGIEPPSPALIRCEDPCEFIPRSVNSRAIFGMEQVGASSSTSETHPFIDLFLNFPLGPRLNQQRHKQIDPPVSLWTDFRFTASSVQSFANLANVSVGLVSPVFGTTSKINNVVQTFQASGGIEYRFLGEDHIEGSFIPGKNSLSLIAGAGITSPLSSQQTAQAFVIPKVDDGMGNMVPDPRFIGLFNTQMFDFTGKDTVVFISPERDRFLKRWFVGLRLKSRFFENEEKILDQAPAMLDVTFGQDESITKTLARKIMTFEGFMPFPIKKYDYIYFFGGSTFRLTRKVNESVPTIFLQPDLNPNFSDSKTIFVPIDASDLTRSGRDTFRFGIGIDLIRLINHHADSTEKATSQK